MRISNLKKQLVIIGIVIAAAIVIIPQAAMAGGGGGAFPGAGCDPDYTWKYDPPGFTGEVRIFLGGLDVNGEVLFNNEIHISTPDDQPLSAHGQCDEDLVFDELSLELRYIDHDNDPDTEPILVDDEIFPYLKSVDMQGICLDYQGYNTCIGYGGNIELLSVGKMKFGLASDGRMCFDAQVLIMPLTGTSIE